VNRPLKAGLQLGNYELERKLGVGGMGEVWLAHPTVKGHRASRVVIKRVHDHLARDPRITTLFEDELQLLQRIEHPNIVRLYEGGQHEDEFFMAMEYIDGLDLHACLAAHDGPLWPAFAAAVIAQATIGLHHAHELKDLLGQKMNLVHRDISPDNLLLDRHGNMKVVDFGIARAETSQATTFAGTRKGKVRYMAPEYLVDAVQSPKTDVHSLGVSLWELVTGHQPFQGLHGPAVMREVVNVGLPRAKSVRPSVPDELDDVIAAAVAPAKKRLPTMKAFGDRLRDFLEEYPPPSPAEMGEEVSLWKRRMNESKVKLRLGGMRGQLESTEMVPVVEEPDTATMRRSAFDLVEGPPSVELRHALDKTEFNVPLRTNEATDKLQVRSDDSSGSVKLPPDLEALATRSRSKKKPPR